MRTIKLLPLFLIGLTAATAHGDRRNPLDGQPAIRHRVEMRKLRFEVTPQFIASINQDYRHAFGPGLKLQFHIRDWIAVGVEGSWTFNSNTPLEDQVLSKLPDGNVDPYVYPGPQPTQQIHNEHVLNVSAAASAYVSLTPFSGKFALFSALFLRYDMFFNLGLGLVYYTQNGCCADTISSHLLPDPNTQDGSIYAGLKVGGMFGFGTHLFFTDWIGMTLEFKDYFVNANPGGLDANGDRRLDGRDEGMQHNIFFGVGVSFMLPPTAKITQ